MFDAGDKVTFKGVEHTVLKTYEQTMVQIVDDNNHVRSASLMQIISETMSAIAPPLKEPKDDT